MTTLAIGFSGISLLVVFVALAMAEFSWTSMRKGGQTPTKLIASQAGVRCSPPVLLDIRLLS